MICKMLSHKKQIIMAVLFIFVTIPVVMFTRYSFPAQDDFDYVYILRDLMDQGYSLIGQSVYMTHNWYNGFGGMYSSTFFGYLISGIVMCNPTKIRIFELMSILFFIISVAIFIFAVTAHLFRLPKKESLTIYAFFCTFIFAVAYYVDFDVCYWFITSIQYLMLFSFGILGVGLYVLAYASDCTRTCTILSILACVCGFIAAGANLSISALNLLLYVIVDILIVLSAEDKKRNKWLKFVPIVPFLGSMINGLAPGNYIRVGEAKSAENIIIAAKSSFRVVVERIDYYLREPEFWIVLIAFILLTLFIPRKQNGMGFKIKYPLILVVIWGITMMGVSFPVMIGYGYEVFALLIRGQVVLDLALFITLIFIILIMEQWYVDKYGEDFLFKIKKDISLFSVFLILALCLQLFLNNERDVAIHREYADLLAGGAQAYTDYYLDILDSVEKADGEIAVIWVDDEVKEDTMMINPLICYDECYDPEEKPQNNCIAHFYKKKGVWVLHKGYVPTDEDYQVAKKYGVQLD